MKRYALRIVLRAAATTCYYGIIWNSSKVKLLSLSAIERMKL